MVQLSLSDAIDVLLVATVDVIDECYRWTDVAGRILLVGAIGRFSLSDTIDVLLVGVIGAVVSGGYY